MRGSHEKEAVAPLAPSAVLVFASSRERILKFSLRRSSIHDSVEDAGPRKKTQRR